ncbi:MAG TPA: hypothetical protein VH913_17315 [Hyphomicrobiaceae bacterium]|jgi:hypothetical protein
MPVAFAMLLSVAAGLSLAAEHAAPPATNGVTLAKQRGTDTTGTDGQFRAPGVGSRALTGNEAAGASGQPSTGVHLDGPPIPAVDTPQ